MKDLKKEHAELLKKLSSDLGGSLRTKPDMVAFADLKLNRVLLEKIDSDLDPTPDNIRVTLNDLALPFVKAVSVNVDVEQPLSTVTLTLYANVEIK